MDEQKHVDEELNDMNDSVGDTGAAIPDFLKRDHSPEARTAPSEDDGTDASPIVATGTEELAGAEPASSTLVSIEGKDAAEDAEHGVAEVAAGAMSAVSSFFSEGAGAVRAMSAAKRAHAEAREHLEGLEKTIADEEDELTHRRDIAERYEEILTEERARIAAAEEKPAEAVATGQQEA